MVKLPEQVTVRESKYPGRVLLESAFDPALQQFVERFPGCQYERAENGWHFPEECLPFVEEAGFSLHRDSYPGFRAFPDVPNKALFEFQKTAAEMCLQKEAALISFEMGLGKTLTAIEVLRIRGVKTALIVCPAFVRPTWVDELELWWPSHPAVKTVDSSEVAQTVNVSGLVITSYELLYHFAQTTGWGAIVFDESSNIKKYDDRKRRTKEKQQLTRSRAAFEVSTRNPHAYKLLLTGTPIDTEPKDLHHQLDCLAPGRFGNFWQFVQAYCVINRHKHGMDIGGLNEERAPELRRRLSSIAIRVTKKEVAHLLPKSRTQIIRVKSNTKFNQRALSEMLSSGQRKQHELKTHIEKAGDAKRDVVVDIVKQAIDNGERNILVATYYHHTAELTATALEKAKLGRPIVVVTGDVEGKKRRKMVKDATVMNAVVVASMKSIGVGINEFSQYTTGIIAELYWQPLVIAQLMGRLNRLSSKLPSVWYVPVLEGSLDEPIASVLKRRLKEQEKLYEPGMSEKSLVDGFEVADEGWADELMGALQLRVEDAYL